MYISQLRIFSRTVYLLVGFTLVIIFVGNFFVEPKQHTCRTRVYGTSNNISLSHKEDLRIFISDRVTEILLFTVYLPRFFLIFDWRDRLIMAYMEEETDLQKKYFICIIVPLLSSRWRWSYLANQVSNAFLQVIRGGGVQPVSFVDIG